MWRPVSAGLDTGCDGNRREYQDTGAFLKPCRSQVDGGVTEFPVTSCGSSVGKCLAQLTFVGSRGTSG